MKLTNINLKTSKITILRVLANTSKKLRFLNVFMAFTRFSKHLQIIVFIDFTMMFFFLLTLFREGELLLRSLQNLIPIKIGFWPEMVLWLKHFILDVMIKKEKWHNILK